MPERKQYLNAIPGIIVYELSGIRFCADIREVFGFCNVDSAVPHPAEVQAKKTYFDYQGKKVLFINFHRMFNLKQGRFKREARILFLQSWETMLCFPVNRIVEFIAFDDKITHRQKLIRTESQFLADKLHYDGRTFLYPDYHKILIQWKMSNRLNKSKIRRRRCVMPWKNSLPP